ncbi:non-ribosomal peptide synthetase [Romboutsia lituseburensis]|uniref:non-ribosomal peptide synthetase n=1 Tax=Romboutsia lituseburensis TaxID=1537 RepID=UPI00215A31D5|nr:non-ribosomal peptide synthetase [Romboutsia lituseburensis]MCR8746647.1 amino acid adenylation domain-containing protein [Romboutsia lituseburensis]
MSNVDYKNEAKDFINSEACKLLNKTDISLKYNLIEMGISSIQVMKISSSLRKFGIIIPFAKLISNPTIEKWNELVDRSKLKKIKKYNKDTNKEYDEDSFALTDVQQAYWVGREDDQPLGGVSCHAYLEFDGENINPNKLEKAWNTIQNYHPMLRAKFLENGRQIIMNKPYSENIDIYDLTSLTKKDLEIELDKIREKISNRKLDVEKGQVAGLAISILPNNNSRVHIDIDLLVADVMSMSILIEDLSKAYNGEKFIHSESKTFKDYLLSRNESEKNEEDKAFWNEKIKTFSEEIRLPFVKKPELVHNPKFKRKSKIIEKNIWQKIKNKATSYKQTPSMFLLTCYALILERWCKQEQFLINIPLFNRSYNEDYTQNMVADFTNLLLLEFNKKDCNTFLQTIETINKTFVDNVNHSNYSGVLVQRDIFKLKGESYLVAPVVFACNIDTPLETKNSQKAFGKLNYMISQTPQVWLDFQSYINDEGLVLAWDFVEEIFPKELIDDMFSSLVELIYLLEKEDNWDINIDVLPKKQKKQREEDVNNILPLKYPEKLLYSEFVKKSIEYPNKSALVDGTNHTILTYSQLYNKSLKVATNLINNGVRKGDCIGIILKRGLSQIEGIIGILFAGATYIPIGHNQPKSRREKIYEQVGIKTILTDKEVEEENDLNADSVKIIYIDDNITGETLSKPIDIHPSSSAYIIMTSGSTGMPKGVEITHRSAVNTIDDINNKYNISKEDSILCVSAIDFDLSVYDIFGLLSVGGKLIILDDVNFKNPQVWISLIDKYNITIWDSVPILFDMLVTMAESYNKKLPIKVVMLSGDWIGLNLAERFYAISDNSVVVAMGGGTEASIWSNFLNVPTRIPKEWVSIPYGKALKNQVYKVVDENGRICPNWVSGELCIGGVGVSVGYKGDTGLTKRKFVKDGDITWYKTGDLGRIWDDGTIEFLGRIDNQVKIKGYRIEIGEIESLILEIEGINNCKVITNNKRNALYAFIIKDKTSLIDDSKIKDILISKLPSYMVPDNIIFIEKFLLNKNDKVDTKALMALVNTQKNTNKQVKQISSLEVEVLDIFKEVFENEKYNINSNFFEMGGDSLIAVKTLTLIKSKLGYELKISDIFNNTTVERLANVIYKNNENKKDFTEEEINIHKFKEKDWYKLTDIQHAYWVSRKGYFNNNKQTSNCYFEIESYNLNTEKLSKIINILIKNYKMLRAYVTEDGTKQMILDEVYYNVSEKDISSLVFKDKETYLKDKRKQLLSDIKDVSKWPTFTIEVTKLSFEKSIIHICFDNIFIDALSVGFILNRINELYLNINSVSKFKRSALLTDNLEKYEIDRIYWNNKLKDIYHAPKIAKIPDDKDSLEFKRLYHLFDISDYNNLKSLASNYNLTISNIILSAFSEILHIWSNNDKYTINITTIENTLDKYEFMGEVGDYTSTFLNSIIYEKEDSFYDRTKKIQKSMIKNMEHLSYSGVNVIRDLNKEYKNISMPIVYTSTIGVINNIDTKNIGDIVFSITQTPNVYLDCQVSFVEGRLMVNWDYLSSAFDKDDIENKFEMFIKLIDLIIKEKISDKKSVYELLKVNEVFEEGAI